MTECQQYFLTHLMKMAVLDKAESWAAAKRYAVIDPYRLADMPDLLKAAMTALKGSSSATVTPAGSMALAKP